MVRRDCKSVERLSSLVPSERPNSMINSSVEGPGFDSMSPQSMRNREEGGPTYPGVIPISPVVVIAMAFCEIKTQGPSALHWRPCFTFPPNQFKISSANHPFFSHNKTHFIDSRKLTAQIVVTRQRNVKSVQQSHCEYAEYFARCPFIADLTSFLINILIKTG